jgi:hypothetical protein
VPASSDLRVGTEFAGHRIEAEAGHGGMGVVYRATHMRLERTVALKLIAPGLARDAAFVSRFEREWRLLAALEHPNVIGVYEAGEVDGRLYLSLRWVSGGDLAARLRGTAGLSPPVALSVLEQVAAALDAAHARGVVHRDLKPANVLLEGERAWLTDFGAGKALGATDTRTAPGRWIGTVDYVAPELLDGAEATPRSDVYSFGCMLFEALTGRVPFPRETEMATLWAHRFEPPPSTGEARPGLPPALDDVLRSTLAKDPAERPASAGEVVRAARAAITAPPAGATTVVIPAEPAAAAPPTRAPTAPSRGLAGLVLAAAALVVAGILLSRGDDKPQAETPRAAAPWVERIPLGDDVTAGRVAADPSFAYITDGPNSEVIQVISSSRKVLRRIKLRSPPHDLGLSDDGKHLWVTLEGKQLADIDLETHEPTYVRTDVEGRYVAVTSEDIVVLSPDPDGRLQRVDAARHRTIGAPYDLGGAPTDLDANGDRAVEVTALPPQLHRFAPTLGEPETIDIEADGIPAELLLSGPDGWITDSMYNEVIRFDALSGKALDKVKVGRKPDGIAADGDDIWVANRGGTVERLDAKTARRRGPAIDAKGPLSGDIVASGGVVWAAGTDDLVRIEPREQ